MGFTLTITGTLHFADEAHLEAGLDAFFAVDDDFFLDLHDMQRDGLALTLAVEETSYRSRVETMVPKLAALARYATRGAVRCDDQQVVATADGDPPRAADHRYAAYFAARAGDAARLRELVALGAKLDARYVVVSDDTLLHVAARAGSAEAVEVLLEAGLDVDAVSKSGSPPLYMAGPEVTRSLLAAGANPNMYFANGSILESACTKPGGVMEMLLAAGAVPRADDHGLARTCAALGKLALLRELVARTPGFREALVTKSAVDSAISSRDPVLLDYLLECGAQLPEDFLQEAIRWGAIDLVEAVLRSPEALAACGPSSGPDDAMCRAAFHGRLDIMELLAARGVPLEPGATGKTSPMLEAARSGNARALEWLIERGVPWSDSVPYYASSAAALMVFIRRGHDPEAIDLDEWPQGQIAELRRLLEAWQASR